MTDLYLKFPSEAAATTALAPFMSTEDAPNPAASEFILDTVGIIYSPTGRSTTDGFGNVVPEMAAISGWHVNVRTLSEAGDALFKDLAAQYSVDPEPATPARVWL